MTLQTSYSEPHSFNSTGSYRKRQSERQLHQLIFQAFVAPVIAVGLTFLMLAFGAGMFATITYCAFMISSQLTDSIVYITAASAIASTLFSLITPKISSKRLSLLMLITLTFVSVICVSHKSVCWILTGASATIPIFYWLCLEDHRKTLSSMLFYAYSKTSESVSVE